MKRVICLLSLALLAGCAMRGGSAFDQGAVGQYDFNWRLSGDPAVAPLQVFGTGRQIWLQFSPGQDVPAIFANTPQGDLPLVYRRQDPYVVIDGAWQSLTLRGGRYVARASRQDVSVAARSEQTMPANAARPAAMLNEHQPLSETVMADATAQPARKPSNTAVGGAENPRSGSVSTPALAATSTPASASMPTSTSTSVSALSSSSTSALPSSATLRAGPPDATLRGVLTRWAAASGWTFEPQHWAVDVDIPLAGSAEFPGDFKQAVRALLASTELSERPVQPCFYANQVLRVVAYTQACDRSAVPAGAAS